MTTDEERFEEELRQAANNLLLNWQDRMISSFVNTSAAEGFRTPVTMGSIRDTHDKMLADMKATNRRIYELLGYDPKLIADRKSLVKVHIRRSKHIQKAYGFRLDDGDLRLWVPEDFPPIPGEAGYGYPESTEPAGQS